MQNKRRKIPVFQIIIIIIVLVILGFLLYSFFAPTPKEVDFSFFVQKIQEAATGKAENKFEFIRITDFQRTIQFRINGQDYIAGATSKLSEMVDGWIYGKDIPPGFVGGNPSGTTKWDPTSIFKDGKIVYSSTRVVSPSAIVRFFQTFGPVIIIGTIMLVLFRIQMKAGGGGIFNPGKNQAQKIISNKRFSDIAGNEEVKEEVWELVDYLKNPQKYSGAGARIPKGILLGGPPGTGKTLIAKATAGEANVPFFFISGSNFVEMFVGVGAKRVRELFKEARREGHAIIFIDELDAVGRSRGAGLGGGNDEREQTLNQLLVEMDGMTENSGILVMAATNRTDVLDPALLRPGRFDRSITVNLPDVKEREAILKLHAKGKRIDSDITFASLAKRTPGYSGAQLENVINEAALLSVREETGVITKTQIDEAIDRVMAGPAKKTRTISPEELEMVAYHEAGHAVVGLKVPGGNRVQKITIIPRGMAGGYNLMLPEKEKFNKTKLELEAMIKSYMGGRAAEELIYGSENISTGASDDIHRATSIARRMVAEWGMSDLGPIQYEEPEGSVFLGRDFTKTKVSDAISHEIDTEVRKIIQNAQKVAGEILKENRQLLELIKTSLLENETIVAEEIEYIATHMQLPPKVEIETKKSQNDNLDFDQILKAAEANKPKTDSSEVLETKADEVENQTNSNPTAEVSVNTETVPFEKAIDPAEMKKATKKKPIAKKDETDSTNK